MHRTRWRIWTLPLFLLCILPSLFTPHRPWQLALGVGSALLILVGWLWEWRALNRVQSLLRNLPGAESSA